MQFTTFGMGVQRHFGLALAKTCNATLGFKIQGVGVGCLDVGQSNFAGELGRDGSNFDGHADVVHIGFGQFKFIASGNARF